jgi:hypothetical protein
MDNVVTYKGMEHQRMHVVKDALSHQIEQFIIFGGKIEYTCEFKV